MSNVPELIQRTSTSAYVLQRSLEPWAARVDSGFEHFLRALAIGLDGAPVSGGICSSDMVSVVCAAEWFAQTATERLQSTLDILGDLRSLRIDQLQVQGTDKAPAHQRLPRLRLDAWCAPYGRLVVETTPLAPNDFTGESGLNVRNVLFAKNSKDWDCGTALFEPGDANSPHPRTARQFQVFAQVLSLSTLLRDLNRKADVTVGRWPVRIGCEMVFQDPVARLAASVSRLLAEQRQTLASALTALKAHLDENWAGCNEDQLYAVFARNGGQPSATNDELKQLLGKRRPIEKARTLKVLLQETAESRNRIDGLEKTLAAVLAYPNESTVTEC